MFVKWIFSFNLFPHIAILHNCQCFIVNSISQEAFARLVCILGTVSQVNVCTTHRCTPLLPRWLSLRYISVFVFRIISYGYRVCYHFIYSFYYSENTLAQHNYCFMFIHCNIILKNNSNWYSYFRINKATIISKLIMGLMTITKLGLFSYVWLVLVTYLNRSENNKIHNTSETDLSMLTI